MNKRREAREVRRAAKLRKFEAAKDAMVSKALGENAPRVAVAPPQHERPRLAPHLERELAKRERIPVTAVDGSRYGRMVTWCITKADQSDDWSWAEPRAWTDAEWIAHIQPSFQSFEKLTWGEIDAQASGSGHKMHHGHTLQDLCAEAQTRWVHLGLDQFESIFRFRMGNMLRAWGFIVQAHFFMVWWDRAHAIYPSDPG